MNGHILSYEFNWLRKVISARLQHFLDTSKGCDNVTQILPPDLSMSDEPYAQFVRNEQLRFEERFILILSLVPHVHPNFLDDTILGTIKNQGEFPQLGGVRGKAFRGMLPTAETALFILAGEDIQRRFEIQKIFDADHLFYKKQIIRLYDTDNHEPLMSNRLVLDSEYTELFTSGIISKPRLSSSFPAQLITTEMEWDDLVLHESTLHQIRDIENWIKHNYTLLYDWGMKKKLNPGYRCMFHGPAGTGKTLSVCLLGKYTGRDVFRVDLSTVISKFIGETEKNLANLFDKAQTKNWILFFDEADALFGKRTNVRDAHDKYANQEVAYLLQRIEMHEGLIVLASNFRSNIDEAFTRRFQTIIYFPIPKPPERLLLWKKTLPHNIKYAKNVNFADIAHQYELTGANINNIVQYICLQALAKKCQEISLEDIVEGIRKEYNKEGKML